MNLQNKKTGEVFNFVIKAETDPTESHFKLRTGSGGWEDGLVYGSLDELNAEWKDYEEPKDFWYIRPNGWIDQAKSLKAKIYYDEMVEIGNFFETREEAEKTVEKLKAWTRLRNKGARFKEWFWDKNYGTCIILGDSENNYIDDGDSQNNADLDLLFRSEE